MVAMVADARASASTTQQEGSNPVGAMGVCMFSRNLSGLSPGPSASSPSPKTFVEEMNR